MTILCYHEVDPSWESPMAVRPEELDAHLAWLGDHRRVMPLGAVVSNAGASRSSRHAIALTFDDGFVGLHAHALPIFRRHRLPVMVFLVARTLLPEGLAVDWVDDPPPWPLRTLSLDQIRELREAGVQLGSHSSSHLDLTTLDDAACERDLRESREILGDLLGEDVRLLAYPRGRNNRRVRRAAERAGFTAAVTLPERAEPIDRYGIPRVGVYRGNTVARLRVKSARWYLPIRTSALASRLRPPRKGLPSSG